MRIAIMLGALFVAATASAQEAPKVWRDADLAKPLPQLHRKVDPAILAAMKARADHIPFGAGGFVYGGWEPSAPSEGPVAEYYRRKAAEPREPRYYAAQPLYPFVSVIYSNRPYRPAYPYRPAAPVLPVRGRR